MRKLSTLLLGLLFVTFAFGKSVTIEKANQVANNYFAQYSGKANLNVANSFSHSYNGITTYHVFNYVGGGFVVVSADDAAIPVLAQSNEGFIETEITNPSTKFWFDNYDKEIAHVISADMDNSATIAEWDNIINNQVDAPTLDVLPLCTSTWNQDTWYNFYCPVAAGGPGGKAYAGCVATAMGQIMKYHNFPATGVGSHTYTPPGFAAQTANFGTTNYNFSAMGNTANSASYTSIATLLYHAGVSVNMGYDAAGSGAFSADVPWAISNYFNYLQTAKQALKADYTNTTWAALLKSELDASRPMYYSGSTAANEGHAWVCDGYQVSGSTTKFHMNWGWSGASNGYYAVTASIVAGGYSFSKNFGVVYGIKPGNPNLIVRFTNLLENNALPYGPTFDIACSVVTGTPTAVKLFIDNQLVFTTTQTTISYPWNTGSADLGTHIIRVEAIDATDTVYQEVNVGLSEWVSQNSGFSTASRGIKYIHAVDSNLVWATAYDGATSTNVIQEFTKTINGGTTWTTGTINGCSGLEPGMIFAISKDTAYVPMYKQSGTNPQGVYVTKNGGTTWTRQTSATFSNAASFPNVVHFFNKNDGFCMGDPINGEFELYTTSNGGTTWTLVPAANIANPITGEFGIVGYYSAVGDKAWFGSNLGRVYRSSDKGLHWEASATTLGAKYADVKFRDALNGLAQDKSEGTTGTLSETADGGITWTAVTTSGSVGTADFCYVPGTENTWVSTESNSALPLGASFSFDGGHSWAPFMGTETDQFLAVDFVNNHCGWAGGFSVSATEKGMNKYIGVLEQGVVLIPVSNLIAQPLDNSVHLTWTEPATIPLSYNIYRNDTLLTNTPSLQYHDYPVSNGQQVYCVTAVYAQGESPKSCTTAWITVGVPNTDEAAYRVYPNPANEIINIVAPVKFSEVRLINNIGKVVYLNNTTDTNLHILTQGFVPGMYILQINTGSQIITKKVSINR
jgi:hypothetical protein